MGQNHRKTHIVIAAKQFIYRLGIKTILSVMGIEPELYEANSFENIKKSLVNSSLINFIIISEDIVPIPKESYLKDIQRICPCGKLLVIGDKVIENCSCSQFVLNKDSQKEILEKFQDFFYEPVVEEIPGDSKLLLSERENEVLKAVARGYSNKEIANRLYISVNTVVTHRKNITDKLGIKSIAGLTAYALMNNIINMKDVKQ